jgi:hypothetical protein
MHFIRACVVSSRSVLSKRLISGSRTSRFTPRSGYKQYWNVSGHNALSDLFSTAKWTEIDNRDVNSKVQVYDHVVQRETADTASIIILFNMFLSRQTISRNWTTHHCVYLKLVYKYHQYPNCFRWTTIITLRISFMDF